MWFLAMETFSHQTKNTWVPTPNVETVKSFIIVRTKRMLKKPIFILLIAVHEKINECKKKYK